MITDGSRRQPPTDVLRSFGLVPGGGEVLSGGAGRSVRYGEVVLKSVGDPVEAGWACEVLADVVERGFRVSRPLRARDGRWVVDGWTASTHVAGEATPARRWGQLLDAAHAFHGELASVDQPSFLANRSHRWAHADRVAWREAVADPLPDVAGCLTRLQRMALPVTGPAQLIHGDLSGNVLFADGLPPAIIDFSPYWRAVQYADAIVVVDRFLWFDADRAMLRAAATGTSFRQHLVRAAIFRLVALNERARVTGDPALEDLRRFQLLITEIEALHARAGRAPAGG